MLFDSGQAPLKSKVLMLNIFYLVNKKEGQANEQINMWERKSELFGFEYTSWRLSLELIKWISDMWHDASKMNGKSITMMQL